MKEKKLYCLIIGIFILYCCALTFAIQKSDYSKTNVKQISIISQDMSSYNYPEVADLNTGNSEVQIRILQQEITLALKTLNSSKFVNIYFFNKYIQNQIIISVSDKFIPNYHTCVLFTGMMLI